MVKRESRSSLVLVAFQLSRTSFTFFRCAGSLEGQEAKEQTPLLRREKINDVLDKKRESTEDKQASQTKKNAGIRISKKMKKPPVTRHRIWRPHSLQRGRKQIQTRITTDSQKQAPHHKQDKQKQKEKDMTISTVSLRFSSGALIPAS